MTQRFKQRSALSALAVLLCLLAVWNTPEKRVVRYVEAHQADLQADLDAYFSQDQPLSYDAAIPAVNDWSRPGGHPMVEYLLVAGSGYYGFYYSPDDVPLCFQNADLPLTEANGGWRWQGEGDNRGFTCRLSPRWYYFEAHL